MTLTLSLVLGTVFNPPVLEFAQLIVPYLGEAHIARQIMAIRNTYNLNVAFLSLCIEWSMEEIKQAAKGLIPGISREDILNLILPVPPVEHQKKIVRCVQTCSEKLNAIFQALS